jgi:hypothetical protein
LHLRKKTKINKTRKKIKKKKKKRRKNLEGWDWELRTPEWRVVRAGGDPGPLSCVRGTLMSGAAIKCAMCQVACFTCYNRTHL